MKLITESIDHVQYLEETSDKGEKNLYISGRFLVGGEVNKNKRMYSEAVLDKAVSKYIAERVNARSAWGELNHPSTPSIDFNNVSHRITQLTKEGTYYNGKAIICENAKGDTVRGLIKCGGAIGVSSRGMGTLKEENGVMHVQPDYMIATAADIVADPSAPGAFVQGIMENVEWFMAPNGNWQMVPVAESIKKEVKRMTARQLEEAKVRLFEQFLDSLNPQNHK